MNKGLPFRELKQNEYYKCLLSGRTVFITSIEEQTFPKEDGNIEYLYTVIGEYYNKVNGRIEEYYPSQYTLEKL